MTDYDVSIITPARITTVQQLGWLAEAVESAAAQGDNVEVVVVNDHSPISWQPIADAFRKPNVRGATLEDAKGVAAARNYAASLATAPLILPMDADDRLPKDAVAGFLSAWRAEGKRHGVVYSNVLMFSDGTQRLYKPPAYSFDTLLHATFMTVGCLHRKSDWERSGGWKYQLDTGFEDWEYWINLGELGVCGYHIDQTLYEYRRNDHGRLAALRADKRLWDTAYATLRRLHLNTYNGRRPEMCCGGSIPTGVRPGEADASAGIRILEVGSTTVSIVYRGPRTGSFGMRGASTGTRYMVPGRGKPFNVAAADAQGFLNYAGNMFVRAA